MYAASEAKGTSAYIPARAHRMHSKTVKRKANANAVQKCMPSLPQ